MESYNIPNQRTANAIEIRIRGERGIKSGRYYVDLDDSSVGEWDEIAGHYTPTYLPAGQQTRIIKLARAGSIYRTK